MSLRVEECKLFAGRFLLPFLPYALFHGLTDLLNTHLSCTTTLYMVLRAYVHGIYGVFFSDA